ncbi:MAG TPA: hypothetical protein VFT22_28940 [Kofleriaceae bacterium]|nr:hypothetical protein [Kofleriaceae bacterium]
MVAWKRCEGAKGVGEASAVAGPIAVAHALYDALGVQLDLTTTPEDVAEQLHNDLEGVSWGWQISTKSSTG